MTHNEASKATGIVRNVPDSCSTFLTFEAENQYGKRVRTIELVRSYDGKADVAPLAALGSQKGNEIPADYVLGSKAPIALKLAESGNADSGHWTFEYQLADGGYASCGHEAISASADGCEIYPDMVDFDKTSRTVYIVNEKRDCYRARVGYRNGTDTHYRYLLFGKPASSVKINDVNFKCGYWDSKWESIMPTSILRMDVASSGATEVMLIVSDKQYFSFDEFTGFGSSPLVYRYKGRDSISVTYNEADWGEVYAVAACNDFGHTVSDERYFSTDFIQDPDILDHIWQVQNRPTGVTGIAEDSGNVIKSSDNSAVMFVCEMDSVSVYDLSGVLLVEGRDCTQLDISHLPKGIYIVSASWTDNSGKARNRNIKLMK